MTIKGYIDANHGKGTGREARARNNRRKRLFEEQQGKCIWCNQQMELNQLKLSPYGLPKENPRFASFEHLLPKEKGGKNNIANVALAHQSCNNKRHIRKWAHDPVYGKSIDSIGR